MTQILVTGAAGFIGSHVCERLLNEGHTVTGLDNLNPYCGGYTGMKQDRLARLLPRPRFDFVRADLTDREAMANCFAACRPEIVISLAAQAGVRYSMENPQLYVDSNVTGFLNVLEECRRHPVGHLVYASSSSVYGSRTDAPFSTRDNVDHPISLYAATKKANELMAHTYSHLYRLPTTGLRFFTVYGPWGRTDMAPFLFTKAIVEGKPIRLFNGGQMLRDFTFVDDIVEGILRVMVHPATPVEEGAARPSAPHVSSAPYRLYNLGNGQPVDLLTFVSTLEECLGRKAEIILEPMQPGDVPSTCADVDDLVERFGFSPNTPLKQGLRRFTEWYLDYFRIASPQEQEMARAERVLAAMVG
jgi:UDP-glucuronate 4-epimerase